SESGRALAQLSSCWNPTRVETRDQPRLLEKQRGDRRRRNVLRCVAGLGRSFGPYEGELEVVIRPRRIDEQPECGAEHRALAVRVVRPSQRPADRIADAGE